MSNPADKNQDAIIRQVVGDRVSRGQLRPAETERAVALSHDLWHGTKGNGQAVDDAVRIIQNGH